MEVLTSDVQQFGFIALKLIHAAAGGVVGIVLLWIMRATPLKRLTDSQQDEIDAIGKKVKEGETITMAESVFCLACSIKDSILIATVIVIACWLAVAL